MSLEYTTNQVHEENNYRTNEKTRGDIDGRGAVLGTLLFGIPLITIISMDKIKKYISHKYSEKK